MRTRIKSNYFEWLFGLACGDMYHREISYRSLLMQLYSTTFTYSIRGDFNRAEDGIELRYRFAQEQHCEACVPYLDGPCNVLEMMVALAIRCEEEFMDDPDVGDRTKQWFWCMINNLGLNGMSDDNYDESFVEAVITRFLNREYDEDGSGGLFQIKHCRYDLRDVEIWYQLCWYLNGLV